MKTTLKQVTFLGKLNDINFQAVYEFEFEDAENINTVSVIENMTKRFKLAGVQPPVGKSEKSLAERQTNATGFHPVTDRVPAIDDTGRVAVCPNCANPALEIISGLSKKDGKPWKKQVCQMCDYSKWLSTTLQQKG